MCLSSRSTGRDYYRIILAPYASEDRERSTIRRTEGDRAFTYSCAQLVHLQSVRVSAICIGCINGRATFYDCISRLATTCIFLSRPCKRSRTAVTCTSVQFMRGRGSTCGLFTIDDRVRA